ncbi:hypothetical protein Taro_000865 [Colocasia esculenta]|uniref:Uncharacterized protein n=1 Tax=Colocasia esculenta TaxID=4460 RepID=A0A843TEC5_COLES|nr:hypothetical protein [Colocasia esculenta]
MELKVKKFPECVDLSKECVDTLSQTSRIGSLGRVTSIDTTSGCVDTLSRTDKQVFWELDLVSTPLEAMSTHCTDLSSSSENTTCVSYVHLLTTEEPLAQVQYKLEHDDSNLFEFNNSKKPKR